MNSSKGYTCKTANGNAYGSFSKCYPPHTGELFSSYCQGSLSFLAVERLIATMRNYTDLGKHPKIFMTFFKYKMRKTLLELSALRRCL